MDMHIIMQYCIQPWPLCQRHLRFLRGPSPKAFRMKHCLDACSRVGSKHNLVFQASHDAHFVRSSCQSAKGHASHDLTTYPSDSSTTRWFNIAITIYR